MNASSLDEMSFESDLDREAGKQPVEGRGKQQEQRFQNWTLAAALETEHEG